MTAPAPGSIFRRNDPREPDAVRVENRSDRVWVFGFVRLVPGFLFLGGVIGMAVLMNSRVSVPLAVAFAAGIAVVAIPLFLERSSILDPVDLLLLGKEWVHVKRLAGKRNIAVGYVRRVEIVPPAGEDYDERQKVRRYLEVTLRFRGLRPSARLLVSPRESTLIADWAAQSKVEVEVSAQSRAD